MITQENKPAISREVPQTQEVHSHQALENQEEQMSNAADKVQATILRVIANLQAQ